MRRKWALTSPAAVSCVKRAGARQLYEVVEPPTGRATAWPWWLAAAAAIALAVFLWWVDAARAP